MKKFKIRTDKMNDYQIQEEEEDTFWVIVGSIALLGILILLVCLAISFFAGVLWMIRL